MEHSFDARPGKGVTPLRGISLIQFGDGVER